MVSWLRNSPTALQILIIAVACQTTTSVNAQNLPHQRVSESIASKFTITIPLKQCQYPRLWSERGTPSVQTSLVGGSPTHPQTDPTLASTSPAPPYLPGQKLTKLFERIATYYTSLGYTRPSSVLIIDSHAPNAFIRNKNEVVLTKALIGRVTDESELAFILAHEMAHLALGHDLRGGISAEVEADTLALKVATALNFNPCSGFEVLERLGSPAKITLVSVTPRLHALHDQTLNRCG